MLIKLNGIEKGLRSSEETLAEFVDDGAPDHALEVLLAGCRQLTALMQYLRTEPHTAPQSLRSFSDRRCALERSLVAHWERRPDGMADASIHVRIQQCACTATLIYSLCYLRHFTMRSQVVKKLQMHLRRSLALIQSYPSLEQLPPRNLECIIWICGVAVQADPEPDEYTAIRVLIKASLLHLHLLDAEGMHRILQSFVWSSSLRTEHLLQIAEIEE